MMEGKGLIPLRLQALKGKELNKPITVDCLPTKKKKALPMHDLMTNPC